MQTLALDQFASMLHGRWLVAGGAAATASLLLGLYVITVNEQVQRGERLRAEQSQQRPAGSRSPSAALPKSSRPADSDTQVVASDH